MFRAHKKELDIRFAVSFKDSLEELNKLNPTCYYVDVTEINEIIEPTNFVIDYFDNITDKLINGEIVGENPSRSVLVYITH
jgi:hypothetical protein